MSIIYAQLQSRYHKKKFNPSWKLKHQAKSKTVCALNMKKLVYKHQVIPDSILIKSSTKVGLEEGHCLIISNNLHVLINCS